MLTIQKRTIDRIRLLRQYGDGIAAKKDFISVMARTQELAASLGLKKTPGKYSTTYTKSFGLGINATSVAIKFYSANKQATIAVDCTPRKLTLLEWGVFRGVLEALFNGGAKAIWNNFEIGRLEVAMDVKVPFDELACLAPGVSIENLNYLAKGTRYLGQKGARRTYCIYDKRKQIAEKLDVDLAENITRVEVRLRGTKKTLGQLEEFKNPFGPLVTIRKTALKLLCKKYPDDDLLFKFVSVIESGGSGQEAYMNLSKHSKKQLLHRLGEFSLNLNGDDAHWKKWLGRNYQWMHEHFFSDEIGAINCTTLCP